MPLMTQQQQSSVPSVAVIVSLTALVLIFFLTISSIHSISRRIFSGRKYEEVESTSKFYEDEDGVATEETRERLFRHNPQVHGTCQRIGRIRREYHHECV